MNPRTVTVIGGSALVAMLTLTGCSSASPGAAPAATTSATAPASSTQTPPVLPVNSNPIVNTARARTLQVTQAAVEDNVDPATGKAIADRLQLTLKNTGSTPLSGLEVYYEMTDVVTGQKEAYYQKLDALTIPAGQEATVYFDNQPGPGHYPENQFSLYRSSVNQVDFAIQVSADGAKIATATAVKSAGTGEKVD